MEMAGAAEVEDMTEMAVMKGKGMRNDVRIDKESITALKCEN
jgi:hypothetical protein